MSPPQWAHSSFAIGRTSSLKWLQHGCQTAASWSELASGGPGLTQSEPGSRPPPFLGRRQFRPVYRGLPMLAAAGLLATACFGKFALGVTQTIEPNPILPRASVKQEVNVDADGLLGSAVKQAMTDAATKSQAQGQTGTQWQIRDNSEGAAVHPRMSRSARLAGAQTPVAKTSTGGVGARTVSRHAAAWVLARAHP